jgi:hypothetical protein
MKRKPNILPYLAWVISGLLFLAIVAMWIRSFWITDYFQRYEFTVVEPSIYQETRLRVLSTKDSRFYISRVKIRRQYAKETDTTPVAWQWKTYNPAIRGPEPVESTFNFLGLRFAHRFRSGKPFEVMEMRRLAEYPINTFAEINSTSYEIIIPYWFLLFASSAIPLWRMFNKRTLPQ